MLAALRADVGSLSWRARGRGDGSEALTLSGIHLGAVDASGQFTGQPWALADVSQRAAALESRAFRRQLHRTTLDAPASKLADRRLQQAAGLATIILAGSWLWH